MSLRWIHENLEAPTCDEECSDIDDSCSDDSYATDLSPLDEEKEPDENENGIKVNRRKKRESRRPPTTTVTFDKNGAPNFTNEESTDSQYIVWDPRKPAENPLYNCLSIKLFCRTGYHLAITALGRACGLTDTEDPHALFHVMPVSYGVVRIQSVELGLYLAFNKKGRLYGEFNVNKDSTEWEQWNIGSYDAFRSRKYANEGWWIGIKKNGRTKPGAKTCWGQKAIQFLAIRQE